MSLSAYIPEKYLALFSDPEYQQAQKGFNLYLLKEDPEYKDEFKKQSITHLKEDPEYREAMQKELQIPTKEERQEEIQEYCDSSTFTKNVGQAIIKNDEQKILPRLAFIEELNDASAFNHVVGPDSEWEDMTPSQQRVYPEKQKISVDSIPDRFVKIENKFEEYAKKIIPAAIETTVKACISLLDVRTDLFMDFLENSEELPKTPGYYKNQETVLCGSKFFRYFVSNVLPAEYRPKSMKSSTLRKLKMDIFRNVFDKFRDKVKPDEKAKGNRERSIYFTRSKSVTGVTR